MIWASTGEELILDISFTLATLQPEALALPTGIIKLIPPHSFGYKANPRETSKGRTGLTFDPLGSAEATANMTLQLLLHSQRASRLVSHHALDSSLPALNEVIEKLLEATWKSAPQKGYSAEIGRLVSGLVLQHLMGLARSKEA